MKRSCEKLYLFELVPKFATASTLKKLSWQSLVFYSQLLRKTKKDKTDGLFINFSSKHLQKLFGKHYRRHIDALLSIGWIEENSRYKNAEDGFTKSFRIGDPAYQVRHKKCAIRVQKRVYERFRKHSKDKSEADCEYTQLLKQRHDTLWFIGDRSLAAKELRVKVDRKIANIRISRNQRLSSSVLSHSNKARKYVMFGKRGSLANVDVSAMALQLLNRTVKDPNWSDWIQKDFFQCLNSTLDLRVTRKTAKRLFMRAISKKEDTTLQIQRIRHFLRNSFPHVMAHVDRLAATETVQFATQRMEGSLIRAFIMANQDLEMLPANDGVFCGDLDAELIQVRLETFLQDSGMEAKTKITYYGARTTNPDPVEFSSNLEPVAA
jgi:hypothetical protein